MKTILSFVAVCFVAALVGCQTTNPTVAPGTLSECGAKCGAACSKDKSECCHSKDCRRTDMGAVADEKAGCGSACTRDKSDCTGAKRGCSSKRDCQKASDDASLGAVSDEKAGCGAKRGCGARTNRCGGAL